MLKVCIVTVNEDNYVLNVQSYTKLLFNMPSSLLPHIVFSFHCSGTENVLLRQVFQNFVCILLLLTAENIVFLILAPPLHKSLSDLGKHQKYWIQNLSASIIIYRTHKLMIKIKFRPSKLLWKVCTFPVKSPKEKQCILICLVLYWRVFFVAFLYRIDVKGQ